MSLSFAIPLFNKTKEQVFRAVQSCLRQTVEPLEVIIVNDGETNPVLSEELKKLSPLVKIFNQEHAGPGVARNLAIDLAEGTHIAFVDADDIVSPLFVERAQTLCGPNIDFVAFGISDHFSELHLQMKTSSAPLVLEGLALKDGTNRTSWKFQGLEMRSSCGKAYSLGFLRRHSIRFPPLYQGEDVIFNFCLSTYAEKAVFDPDFVAYAFECEDVFSSSRSFNKSKVRQFQNEASTLLSTVEELELIGTKAQEAYYDIVCEVIPAALITVFCNPLNQESARKRYASFRSFLKGEPAFSASIKKIRLKTCPSIFKIATVLLHKAHISWPLFLHYNRKRHHG